MAVVPMGANQLIGIGVRLFQHRIAAAGLRAAESAARPAATLGPSRR